MDVDGVINAVADPFDLPPGYELLPVPRLGYIDHIVHRPVVTARLQRIAERVDFVWHTTWHQDAADMLGPALGLPVLPATPPTADGTGSDIERWWKTRQVIAHGGPALWIDDDLRGYDDELHALDVTGLEWISPDTFDGLSDDELDRIDDWVKRSTSR